VTRAQVQAELAAARADGSIKAWSISYNPLAMAKSNLSREAVKAQRHAGLSDPPWSAKTAARSPCRASVRPARRAQWLRWARSKLRAGPRRARRF
jgi:hypothetical protein